MRNFFVIAVLLFSCAAAHAGDKPTYMPFPEAHISESQWESYRQLVVGAYGSSLRHFPDEHLEAFYSPDHELHFAFTTDGHPAHPAWITRSARDGGVDQIGYFAGQEEPFAELFQAFLDLTERTIEASPEEAPTVDEPTPGAGG